MSWRRKEDICADQSCCRISGLNGVGFLIASIHWKYGGHDFGVSFSKIRKDSGIESVELGAQDL